MMYRCPFCETAYKHEALTRAHITATDDWDHINEHGYSSETEIEVIDDSANVIETSTKQRDEVDFSSLDLDDLPDEYDKEEKIGLIIAAYFPEAMNYHMHDETISMNKVLQFYNSQFPPDDEIRDMPMGEPDSPLEVFTPMQQAILIAKIFTDLDDSKIAELTDAVPDYPQKTFDNAKQQSPEFIDRLRDKQESGKSVEEILKNELSDTNLRELKSSGYLSTLPIDFPYEPDTNF